jgi:hypothetical protein
MSALLSPGELCGAILSFRVTVDDTHSDVPNGLRRFFSGLEIPNYSVSEIRQIARALQAHDPDYPSLLHRYQFSFPFRTDFLDSLYQHRQQLGSQAPSFMALSLLSYIAWMIKFKIQFSTAGLPSLIAVLTTMAAITRRASTQFDQCVISSMFYCCKSYFDFGSFDDFDDIWPFLQLFYDTGFTLPDEAYEILTLTVLNIASVENPGAFRDAIFLYLERISSRIPGAATEAIVANAMPLLSQLYRPALSLFAALWIVFQLKLAKLLLPFLSRQSGGW